MGANALIRQIGGRTAVTRRLKVLKMQALIEGLRF